MMLSNVGLRELSVRRFHWVDLLAVDAGNGPVVCCCAGRYSLVFVFCVIDDECMVIALND